MSPPSSPGDLMNLRVRQRKLTQEEKNFELAQREIDRMKKEVKQYETPDHYAKFGKMNRQILKMEKELVKLKALAD